MSIAAAPRREIVIRPPSRLAHLDLAEIYRYRHMMWSLVWRDIRVQFDQMYLGMAWSVARPLLTVLVFVLFRRFSGADTRVSIPYSIYVYSGLIFWFYFLEGLRATSTSVKKNAGLITKIYFPRLITAMVPLFTSLYGLIISLGPLVVMMLWLDVYPGWRLVLLPAVIVQCMLLVLGAGTLFASLSLTNRDIDRFLDLVLYLGMFVSPVIFSPEMIPAAGRSAYFVNPMAGTLLAFRSCLFSDFPFPLWQWAYSLACSVLFLVIGTTMYRRAEISFADKL